MVILHRAQVHVLPEVGLLRGVRGQQTLPVQPLLCSDETVKPAGSVVKVIYNQRVWTTEQVQ